MENVYDIISSNKLEKILECEDIINEETEEAIKIGEKLIETSVQKGGVGLAAPQCGINKKIIVFSFTNSKDEMLYQIAINPQYFPNEKKKTKVIEGCLSYPDKHFMIERYKYIRAVFYNWDAKKKELVKIMKNMRGEEAICFAHETDHLYGKHCGMIGKLFHAD